MSMDSSWIPDWAQVLGVVAYAVILLLHARHAWLLRGPGQAWHLGHIVMALGMIDMFWPSSMPVGEHGGEIVFVVATVLAAAMIAVSAATGWSWRAWVLTTVDLAGMIYMFAEMSHRSASLTLVLVVWSVAEALLWLTGAAFPLLGLRPADASADAGADSSAGADAGHGRGGHFSATAWDVRLSLAVMLLGMAYMFLAMQYGVPGHGPMGHMGHMSGM